MYLLCDHLKSSSLVVKIHSYYYHVITYHTRAKMRKNSAIQGNQTSAFFLGKKARFLMLLWTEENIS